MCNAKTHRIQDVNPALVTLLGYSREEYIGRTLEDFGFLPTGIGEEVPLEAMGTTGDYYRCTALPIRAKDGREVVVDYVAVAFQVGDETTIQCNLRDVTERNYFEMQLQEKNRELEAARSRQGSLPRQHVARAAHAAERDHRLHRHIADEIARRSDGGAGKADSGQCAPMPTSCCR